MVIQEIASQIIHQDLIKIVLLKYVIAGLKKIIDNAVIGIECPNPQAVPSEVLKM